MRALGNNVIVEPAKQSDSVLIVIHPHYSVLSIGSLVPTSIRVGSKVLIADDKLHTIGTTTYCNCVDIIAVI